MRTANYNNQMFKQLQEVMKKCDGLSQEIKNIKEEQDIEISYYYGQELSNVKTSIPEYLKSIEEVSKQDIIDVANNININTIYFLRD